MNWKPSDLGADLKAWFDPTDEATHVMVDGSRYAQCRVGSGETMGPLEPDGQGRWALMVRHSRDEPMRAYAVAPLTVSEWGITAGDEHLGVFRPLSNEERDRMEAYLRDTWGLGESPGN
jgi:hypothetical protein